MHVIHEKSEIYLPQKFIKVHYNTCTSMCVHMFMCLFISMFLHVLVYNYLSVDNQGPISSYNEDVIMTSRQDNNLDSLQA